jgi:hypothetical protein
MIGVAEHSVSQGPATMMASMKLRATGPREVG